MKVQFRDSVSNNEYTFRKGQVIDSSARPPDQMKRWLNRGLVVEVAEETESAAPTKRFAIIGRNRRKAIT